MIVQIRGEYKRLGLHIDEIGEYLLERTRKDGDRGWAGSRF